MVDPGKAGNGHEARRIFGERADRYSELDVFSEEKFYLPILEAAAPRPGERVLDLAAGTGLLALLLARIAAEVTGADVTPEMLERARARVQAAGRGNVTFVEAKASELPFPDGSFDLVTCRTAFHHFVHPRQALSEIHRVLAKGGRFVMEDVFGPDDDATRDKRERLEKLFDPSHVLAYRPSELRSMLGAAGFSIEREVRPATRGLSLGLVMKLERIADEGDRADIVAILDENLDSDLGGFQASEKEGETILKWQTIILAAARE